MSTPKKALNQNDNKITVTAPRITENRSLSLVDRLALARNKGGSAKSEKERPPHTVPLVPSDKRYLQHTQSSIPKSAKTGMQKKKPKRNKAVEGA